MFDDKSSSSTLDKQGLVSCERKDRLSDIPGWPQVAVLYSWAVCTSWKWQTNNQYLNLLLFWKEHLYQLPVSLLRDLLYAFPPWCFFHVTVSALLLCPCISSFQIFLPLFSISSGRPSIGSGLRASSSSFPAAATREDSHETASALFEEDRQTTTRVRRQNDTKTGLPTRLQHTQMYEVNHIVFSNSWKCCIL